MGKDPPPPVSCPLRGDLRRALARSRRALLALALATVRELGEVELFTVALCAVLAVGFSLVPLVRTLRLDLQSSLKDGRGSGDGGGKVRWRRLLVAGQMALAVMLLVGAGLLITDPGFTNSFVIVGRESESADQGELKTRLVSDGYFRTAGVTVLGGRAFHDRDTTESTPVLILNAAAVKRYFPDGRAIGEHIRFWGTEREVVGVVADERMNGLAEAAPPAMYVPIPQAPPIGAETLMVRSGADPRQLVPALREAVWAIDREIAVYNVATLDETLAESLARERFTSVLLGVFAAVALGLAVLGVHGVLSYAVTLRHREVGLRMALGASRPRVMRMVLAEGMGLAAAGISAGLLASFLASSLLAGLLYGVSPKDVTTYATATAVLALAALLACALPARRATRVDPAAALRAE